MQPKPAPANDNMELAELANPITVTGSSENFLSDSEHSVHWAEEEDMSEDDPQQGQSVQE